MKTLTFSAMAWLLASGLAVAQEAPRSPLVRGDAQFVIGWQNLRKEQPPQPGCCQNDWLNNIVYGGAGAGWYWTDHLKTQVDVGGGTRADQYRYSYITTNGQSTSSSSRLTVQQRNVAVGQQYQFFRNQWFHPHLGAGVDIAWETTRETYQATFVFDNTTHTSTQIAPGRAEEAEHRAIARLFGEAGFKAYMTRRAFFTGDSRVMFRKGLDEVLFRVGFGIDF